MLTNQQRLLALDVMRGITISGMIMVNNPGSWNYVYAPLRHAPWDGLTPTDLVFPFFMFIMGVSLHMAFGKYTDGLNTRLFVKIMKRAFALFAVGLALEVFSRICAGTLSFDTFRIMGVMQRLSLAYLGAALITLIVKRKYHLYVVTGILLAYIVAMHLFDGYVQSPDNLLSIIDTKLLGAEHIIKESAADGTSFPFDPLGLLSTLPSIAQVMIGVFAGSLITSGKNNQERIIEQLFILGSILLFSGYLLQYLDPINKKLWTSSYTIITSGMGALFLALLIWVVDIRNRKRWCRPFEAFGVNPLFMYVVGWVLAVAFSSITLSVGEGKTSIKGFLYNGVMQPVFGDYLGSLIYSLLFVGLVWISGYILYKKKIYIKL